jgi:undecaprenyl phosphate-alpha-L-ara4N flippase subunit ArnE
MLLWLWVLGRVPLSQAFAFFGLSFFLVPALAHRFLGDAVSWTTWVGATIILAGIVVTNWRTA